MAIELLHDTRIELNVAVLVLGLLILLVGVFRDFLNAKVPASAITVAMFAGILLGPHVINVLDPTKWSNSNVVVQEISKIVIAVQLMASALNIPYHYLKKAWRSQLILLTLVVALMWLTSGFLIYAFFQNASGGIFKFSIWEALLIGACVAPTDPVLASAVSTSALAISQVPARVRHTITAESMLNDGSGFPFVMLAIRFLKQGSESTSFVIRDWIVNDILWEIGVATLVAVVLGYLVGRMLVYAEPAKLHDQQLLVALTIALAFGFGGGAQLIGINGFVVVAVGGVVYARMVEGDKRGAESQLQETVDLIFSTLIFAIFGLFIPFDRWHQVGWWRGILLCLSIAVLRRVPWILVLRRVFLKTQLQSLADALFAGWFGPIGVGAIFYALFAAEELGNDRAWVVISMIVFTQVLLFGVTDTFFTRWYATTNPNYIRRRRRKQREISRAESQIKSIAAQLQHNISSMPVSPVMRPTDEEGLPPPDFDLDDDIPLPRFPFAPPASRQHSTAPSRFSSPPPSRPHSVRIESPLRLDSLDVKSDSEKSSSGLISPNERKLGPVLEEVESPPVLDITEPEEQKGEAQKEEEFAEKDVPKEEFHFGGTILGMSALLRRRPPHHSSEEKEEENFEENRMEPVENESSLNTSRLLGGEGNSGENKEEEGGENPILEAGARLWKSISRQHSTHDLAELERGEHPIKEAGTRLWKSLSRQQSTHDLEELEEKANELRTSQDIRRSNAQQVRRSLGSSNYNVHSS